MSLTGIFKKLFKRSSRTVLLARNTDDAENQPNPSESRNTGKAVFDISHTVEIGSKGVILISGLVKCGIFKTGDKIIVVNADDKKCGSEAVITEIKTPLVDVNRIDSGKQADLMIKPCSENKINIMPGSRAYRIREERSNVI